MEQIVEQRTVGRRAVLATAAASLAAVRASAQTPAKMRAMYVPAFTGHLPVLLAEDAGFYKANGLDVELIGSNEAIKPLISGDCDVMFPAPSVAALAVSQNAHVKIVVSVQSRITQELLVLPDVAKALKNPPGAYPAVVKELAGKKLGVSVRGGSVDIDLRYLLMEAGLTPDSDVSVVPLGSGGAMVAAMRAKQVDGILGFPPLTQQLLLHGDAVKIIDLAKGEGPPALSQPFVTAAVTDQYLAKNQDTVRRFVTAMVQTLRYIRDPANKGKVSSMVATRLSGIDPAVVGDVVTEMVATMNPTFSRTDLDRVNEVQRKLAVLPRDIRPDEILAENMIPKSP